MHVIFLLISISTDFRAGGITTFFVRPRARARLPAITDIRNWRYPGFLKPRAPRSPDVGRKSERNVVPAVKQSFSDMP